MIPYTATERSTEPPPIPNMHALRVRVQRFIHRPPEQRDAELAAIRDGATRLDATDLSWMSRFLDTYPAPKNR